MFDEPKNIRLKTGDRAASTVRWAGSGVAGVSTELGAAGLKRTSPGTSLRRKAAKSSIKALVAGRLDESSHLCGDAEVVLRIGSHAFTRSSRVIASSIMKPRG